MRTLSCFIISACLVGCALEQVRSDDPTTSEQKLPIVGQPMDSESSLMGEIYGHEHVVVFFGQRHCSPCWLVAAQWKRWGIPPGWTFVDVNVSEDVADNWSVSVSETFFRLVKVDRHAFPFAIVFANARQGDPLINTVRKFFQGGPDCGDGLRQWIVEHTNQQP